jgi:hypothetical protein
MHGYIALYRGRKTEVMAPTSLEAQRKAAEYFKARKSWEVQVYLCEKDGQAVIHKTSEI